MPLKPGEVLRGRYRMNRIIGQGGMGSIYLADDLRLEGRQCAVKEVEHDRTLPVELVKQARDQFQREATVLARLDHPNLPKVSDYFSIGTRDYLVMDFVPGKDLRTMMIEARQSGSFLPEQDVLDWANQLADALSYLHNQNPPILHRDIKPGNLKVTPSNSTQTGRLWPGQTGRSRRSDHHHSSGTRYRALYSTRTVWRRQQSHRYPVGCIFLRDNPVPYSDEYTSAGCAGTIPPS